MLPYEKWNIPLLWIVQHNNDPKHTAQAKRGWLRMSFAFLNLSLTSQYKTEQ